MLYRHLTMEERETIDRMHFSGHSQVKIARELNRSAGTICRELKRNSRRSGYTARTAQQGSESRRRDRPLRKKLDDPLLDDAVRSGLAQEWSPEEISGRLRRETPDGPQVSHQTIYRWLRRDCPHRAHFASFLRHGRYRRRGTSNRSGPIANRTPISERPAEATLRQRLGDWEGDTMIGARHSGSIVTVVDRKSGYLLAAKMSDGRAWSLNRAAERAFRAIPAEVRHTLTVDNGSEFAGHQKLSRRLRMSIYFADPYCSNQRATNENTNGLLRQYYPKGKDFLTISHQDLAFVVARLNNRPRKRLDYQTPCEVLEEAGIALQM